MLSDEIPTGVLNMVPEIEWCCGTLVTKPKLVQQVNAIVKRAAALEHALKQVCPEHPLLKRVPNNDRAIKSSPIKTPTF